MDVVLSNVVGWCKEDVVAVSAIDRPVARVQGDTVSVLKTLLVHAHCDAITRLERCFR